MEELLKAWGVRATEVRAVGAGTNNASYFVGDEFVLRIHHNTTAPDYEHAVLRALGGLSFAVPVPIASENRSTVVRGELDGQVVTASLSRRIPGEHPRGGDMAEACGDALAELDEALAKLDPATLPARNVWDGDLTKLHPRVADPGELLASLDGAERREQVARIFAVVQTARDLPQSIIHADYFPTNVLMDGSRVTAILDFEVAGPGYRAMDLAIGLGAFGSNNRSAAEAFRRGYLARLPLTDAELHAVPICSCCARQRAWSTGTGVTSKASPPPPTSPPEPTAYCNWSGLSKRPRRDREHVSGRRRGGRTRGGTSAQPGHVGAVGTPAPGRAW